MGTLYFKNNMGDLHIWNDVEDKGTLKRMGLHNSLAEYNNKQSDIYLQNGQDIQPEMDKLNEEKRDDLSNGYGVYLEGDE